MLEYYTLSNMNFSVIIPTYNRLKAITRLVRQLDHLHSKYPYEVQVIVCDNGSSDGTLDRLRSQKVENIELVVTQEMRGGPSFSRNKGISLARHRHLLFFDDDCVLSKNILWQYRQTWIDHPMAKIIGGPIHVRNENGDALTLHQTRMLSHHPWCFGQLEYSSSGYLQVGDFLFSGNLSAINEPVFRFDELFGRRFADASIVYAEDYEICTRYLLQQQKVYFDQKLRITNSVTRDRFTRMYLVKRYWQAGREANLLDRSVTQHFPGNKYWRTYSQRLLDKTRAGYRSFRQMFATRYDFLTLISYFYYRCQISNV